MKNMLRMAVLVLVINFLGITARAQEGLRLILEEEPIRYVKPLIEKPLLPGFAPASVQPSLPHLQMMHEKVEISSLCSANSASSNISASRRNVMGGLVGMSVNTNKLDPAGWYVVLTNGWQWHDLITSTTMSLWRGFTNSLVTGMSGERRGNRMAVHAMGKYPVSGYQCRITGTLSNIQDTTFWVGRDSVTGSNIMFNANFVGIHFGPNGVIESTYNLSSGVWTQRGDDTVYSNGEDPTVVQYTIWVRFGASVLVTANSEIGLNMVRSQFVQTNQTFSSQLIRGGQVINEKIIWSEVPKLMIHTNGATRVSLHMVAGQDFVPHNLQMATQLDGPWMTVNTNLSKNWLDASTYSSVEHPVHMGNDAVFFRLCTQ